MQDQEEVNVTSHLCLAAKLNDRAAVERLCVNDASSSREPFSNQVAALQAAASMGHAQVVKALLDNAYDSTSLAAAAAGPSCVTSLMLAAAGGHVEIMNLLISHGAPVTGGDAQGWDAIHHAALRGQHAACEVLINFDADLNSKSARGETPLELAAVAEHVETCKVLLSYGAQYALLESEAAKAFVGPLMTDLAEGKSPNTLRTKPSASSVGAASIPDSVGSEHSFESEAAPSPHGAGGKSRKPKQLQPRIEGHDTMGSRKAAGKTSQSQAGLSDMRGPSHAIMLPTGIRRAFPMYVPAAQSPTPTNNPAILAALQARSDGADGEWTLHAFSYKGLQEGFLLDPATSLVYYLDAAAAASHTSSRPLPVLVGKLSAGLGGYSNPSLGVIQPLTVNDCATVELSAPAMRCLRRHSPAAALLMSAAKRGDQVLADLAPDISGGPYCSGVSLAVPLCAVLGVHEVSDLVLLTAKDFAAVEVDEGFHAAVLSLDEVAAASPGRTSRSPFVSTGGAALWAGRSGGSAGPAVSSPRKTETAALPSLPTLSQLILKHGLSKLLPLVANRKLLTTTDLQRWSEVANVASRVTLTTAEVARFKALTKSIKAAQESALMLQANRLELLTRLTVGTLVVYEAEPAQVPLRGERLAGIILEDLGSASSCTGKQFKVRDLLDDTLVWQSPGQIRKLTAVEAPTYLRADLLPPATAGTPVSPFSAAPGLTVQLAPWTKQSVLDDFAAGGSGPTPGGEASNSSRQPGEEQPSKSVLQVIGTLLEPVQGNRQVWSVLWPDGITRTHSVGADGSFDLVHTHVHRLAGAPITKSHFPLLLSGKDMLSTPVVRSPLWPRPTTDDMVPGSPGMGFVNAAQVAISVVWSRARNQEPSLYCPDAQGTYPLCHGLLGGTGLSCLAAKPGVLVEAGPNSPPHVVAAAAQGPGTLVQPVALVGDTKVTWRVKWPGGAMSHHDIGTDILDAELQVSEMYMVAASSRVVLLNEVSKRSGKPAATAALAALNKGSSCGCGCGSAASCKRAVNLGRPLFAKDTSRGHQWGMLGSLVKLNLTAISLQPGCEQGPLVSYEPRPLSEQLAMKKEGTLGPAPRDDVGLVVKDAGPGCWRSLLVRKLGSTQSFWYDESVLLPATQDDVRKQVQRCGADYVPPRHLQGVVVTDATAAPGMLVQRAFVAGAAQEGGEKALQVGQLIKSVGPHAWQVAWPDGNIGIYKTGAQDRFQLCYANLHEAAGAPLLASTVASLAALGQGPIPVTDGPHSAGAADPGAVRFVNHLLTQQGLLLHESAQLQATGMVATSAGERCMAGGALRLYELSHAIVPGDAVTVFTAKRGLRVTLAPPEEDEADTVDERVPPEPRYGVLRAPTRLAVKAVIDMGSGTGSGMPGGPTASREPVLLQDPAAVFWQVEWANGRIEEVMVGTQAGQTPLRIAPSVEAAAKDTKAEDEEEEEEEEAQEAQERVVSHDQVVEAQHYVRMIEPVLLLPCADEITAQELSRVAQPLQRAVSWFNQMLCELCNVWWGAACLAAAYAEAGGAGSSLQLLRPHMLQVAAQPDLLSVTLQQRPGGMLRWEPLTLDPEAEVANKVPIELDQQLASLISTLASMLVSPQYDQDSSDPPVEVEATFMPKPPPERPALLAKVQHLLLDPSGRYLDDELLLDDAGIPQYAPEHVASVLQSFNQVVSAFRTALHGSPDQESDTVATQYDLTLSVEPCLSAGVPSSKGNLVLSLARQVAPSLVEPAADSPGLASSEEAAKASIGPVALLTTGLQPVLQKALVQAYRALGSLSAGPSTSAAPLSATVGSTASSTGSTKHQEAGEVLSVVGASQPGLWLQVPQSLFPADVGQARCLALVNSQLFTLRRACAFLNGCQGGGTANVSDMLMAALRVVREKAQAALAVRSCRNLTALASRSRRSADQAIKEQNNHASEIAPFKHEELRTLLSSLSTALQQLSMAEAYAVKACSYAKKAHIPASTPCIEKFEQEDAEIAGQDSREALEQCVLEYNNAYPQVAKTVQIATLSLTCVMRQKLLQAGDLYQVLKAKQQAVYEGKKQVDAAERAAKGSEDDYTAAQQAKERKDGDLEKALHNQQAAERSLEDAKREMQEAQLAQPEGDDLEAAQKALANRRSTAEAVLAEVTDRLAKMRGHVELTRGEVDKAATAVKEAEGLLSQRRSEAEAAKQLYLKAVTECTEASKAARTLDPASIPELKESQMADIQIKERQRKQITAAQHTYAGAKASLDMIQQMQSHVPGCLTAPDAVDRFLGRTGVVMTLLCAATAAETARTAALVLEAALMDLEEQDAIASSVAMIGAAMGSQAGTLSQTRGMSVTVGAMTAGTTTSSAAGAVPGFVPALPPIDEVNRLMGIIKTDVLSAVNWYAQLAPSVPEEASIVDNEYGTTCKAVLATTIDRALMTAAACLEKLGSAAAANVTARIAEAAAAAQQGGANSAGPETALPDALRAARVATIVAETARAFPTAAADIPVSDPKIAATLLSQFRAAQGFNNATQKETTKLSNELTVKLSKSGLGSAATSASVLVSAYADLAMSSPSIVETEYWCKEAVGLYPKVKAAGEAALAALAPPPPAPPAAGDAEGEGGEEEAADKRKEDAAEAAAKSAALAEANKVIGRYISEVAVKLGRAAVDWAQKVMGPISDSSAIEEVSERTAHEIAGLAGEAESHPDMVVSILRALAAPLRVADMAFREAGNHTGLEQVDEDIKDVLETVSEATNVRTRDCLQQVDTYYEGGLAEEDCESNRLEELWHSVQGWSACAKAALEGCQSLFKLVPLILPNESSSRKLVEAGSCQRRVSDTAIKVLEKIQDAKSALPPRPATSLDEQESSLTPSYTRLDVQLVLQTSVTGVSASRPASPTRRRMTKKAVPPPAALSLSLSIPAIEMHHEELCLDVTHCVLEQQSVQNMLAPYHTLLQACNEASIAVHVATTLEPSQADLEALLMPDTIMTGTAATFKPRGLEDQAGTSVNLLQLQRWRAAVENMTGALALIRQGFMDAAAASLDLDQLEVLCTPIGNSE